MPKKAIELLSHIATLAVCVGLAVAVLALGATPEQVARADFSYVVQKGDALSKIAQRNNVTVQALVDANRAAYPCLTTNPACLQVGWTLTIPGGGSPPSQNAGGAYIVQKGDSLSKIAQRFNVTVRMLIEANRGTYPCLATTQTCLQVGWTLALPQGNAPTATQAPAQSTPAPVVTGNRDYWELRQAAAAEINRVRAENGLPAYTWVDVIGDFVQSRSADMAARNYLSHYDPVTGAFLLSILKQSTNYKVMCEIAYKQWGFSSESVPVQSVDWWMNSSGHRGCVLSQLSQFGVGVAYSDEDGAWYATAIMGK